MPDELDKAIDQLEADVVRATHEKVPVYPVIEKAVACLRSLAREPVPMLLWCPACSARHIDQGEFSTKRHHTHACQNCGMTWRPAVVHTVGVQYLPGFKDL